MKLFATRKQEQNEAALDPWTLVHFSTGMAFGLMNVPKRWAVAATVAYELAEQVFERRQWGQELFEINGPETLPNALADSAFFLSGYHLGRQWNERR